MYLQIHPRILHPLITGVAYLAVQLLYLQVHGRFSTDVVTDVYNEDLSVSRVAQESRVPQTALWTPGR